VAQILNLLEPFDLKALRDKNQADYIHVVAEAMKLAFADRAHWLGDSDFTRVPRGLASREYAAQLAQGIDLKRASPVVSHGTPPQADKDVFDQKHTTHIAAADREGNWVAITATINIAVREGDRPHPRDLNNQMDDPRSAGRANAFGLVGAAQTPSNQASGRSPA
jgi:gamma-glutamyltranspeptidase/glutathione hydrolase